MYKQLFESLSIPLKETSNNFVAIFIAIAGAFQSLQEIFQKFMDSCFIVKSSDARPFAEDRGIHRLNNENIDKYKQRVLNAYLFVKHCSTKQGIIDIIANSTEKKFHLEESFNEKFILSDRSEKLGKTTILNDGDNRLTFTVRFDDKLTLLEKDYIDEIIDLYKPAHVSHYLKAGIRDEFILGKSTELLGKNTYLEQ